jgi:hypothetical protein
MDHNCQHPDNNGRAMSTAGTAAVARLQVANTKDKANSIPQKSTLSNVGKDLDIDRQRRQQTRITASEVHSLQQPDLTEEEALRMAMARSLDGPHSVQPVSNAERKRQEELDEALARALQESEQQAAGRGSANSATGQQRPVEKTNCRMS